jgi:hypothetical protein
MKILPQKHTETTSNSKSKSTIKKYDDAVIVNLQQAFLQALSNPFQEKEDDKKKSSSYAIKENYTDRLSGLDDSRIKPALLSINNDSDLDILLRIVSGPLSGLYIKIEHKKACLILKLKSKNKSIVDTLDTLTQIFVQKMSKDLGLQVILKIEQLNA